MQVLKQTFPGGMVTKTEIDGFEIITDYPIELGGENKYPKPWSLFLSTVTSCHGVHVLQYCIENNIPYDKIYLTLDIVEDPEHGEGKYTDFIIKDHLPEDFPEEHIVPMLKETSEDCWINRHLTIYDVKVHFDVIPADGEVKSVVLGGDK